MDNSVVNIQGRVATVAFFRHLSSRKSAEERLRQSEERFRFLVENASDGIAILQRGRIAFLNRSAARLIGVSSPEQAIGMPVADLLKPEDLECSETRVRTSHRTGEPLGSPAFYRARDVEGRDRLVEVSSIPIVYSGEPSVLGFIRDVTERMEMQSKLMQFDRLAALGLLAGGVAHEINNPLAYAKLNLARAARKLAVLARQGKGDGDLVEISQSLSVAEQGLERAADIVRDIQLFARPTPDLDGPLDLKAALERVLSLATYAIGNKANVTCDFAEEVPGISGDASLLEQLLLNLVINAVKSFDDEETENNHISISLRGDGNGGATVQIADNGRGMSAYEVEHALDAFFTSNGFNGGNGNESSLGLCVCKSIVDAMGGQIEVSSRQGEGTTFRVTLPRG